MSSEPKSAKPAGRTLVHAVTGVRIRIVQSGAETAGRLLELEAIFPPPRRGS